jgi:hypothetical protein
LTRENESDLEPLEVRRGREPAASKLTRTVRVSRETLAAPLEIRSSGVPIELTLIGGCEVEQTTWMR